MARIRGFIAELRRRKVIRTTLVYAALAWVTIQVVTTVLPVFGDRETVIRVIVGIILAGLPVAIIVSWLFDFTPDGWQSDSGPPSGETAPVVPADAAPVRGADMITRAAPAPATPLVGRDAEMTELAATVAGGARVVTVTGPGGTGKTRLAIAVADRLRADFPGGVAYVELAAVTDPDTVVSEVALAVGVKEAESRSLAEGLATIIAERRVLLVLDNLEQVLEAAPSLAALLGECPSLHLLCTSRAPLRITGEVEFPLRPLAVPPDEASPLEDLETYPAIELFIDRTRRARPDFRLTTDNAAAVVRICRRLDGLPLALELAAARLRTVEPDVLAQKLEKALDVLTTGARDLPERHRTLRATIDWSHSLLDDGEQSLFRRLAVFAGGWTYDAVGPVCYGPERDDSLDTLESLIEKGLVVRTHGGRFGMLETIREYAVERLAESDEGQQLRRRHAEHFGVFLARAYDDLKTPAQVDSLRRTEAESANVEEALSYLYEAASAGDEAAAASGLAMVGSLWMYWHMRGVHLRAREWSARFLGLPAGAAAAEPRGWALLAGTVAAMTLGDVATALAWSEEAEALGQDAAIGVLHALTFGVTWLTVGDMEQARRRLEEAEQRGREFGGPWELGLALSFMGIVETASGNLDVATARFNEALVLQRAIGDRQGLGTALGGLASVEALHGRHEQALALYLEALDAYHAIGDRPEEARILDACAWTCLALNRYDDAREYFAASIRAYEDVGSVRGTGIALLGLAATEAAEGRPERAVRIAAAAQVFSEREGIANDYARGTSAPGYLDTARASLHVERLEALEAEGRALSVRDAVRYALDPSAPAAALQPA